MNITDEFLRFWQLVVLRTVFGIAVTLLGRATAPVSDWLVRRAARRLPIEFADECESQWLADLHDLAPWLRLRSALSIFSNGREIASALAKSSRRSLKGAQQSSPTPTGVLAMPQDGNLEEGQQQRYDALTGLENAAALERRLRQLSGPLRRRGSGLSIVIVDIDNFRSINRLLGPLAGDALLREFGRRLRRSVRRRAYLGRLGGDEFAIVLPNTSPSMAREIAERLRFACEISLVVSCNRAVPLSASVGMLTATRGLGSDAILDCAQEALSIAKTQGRNCVREFTPGASPSRATIPRAMEGPPMWNFSVVCLSLPKIGQPLVIPEGY
jgi:diguanylate cyclase (GGDEF)-like protein